MRTDASPTSLTVALVIPTLLLAGCSEPGMQTSPPPPVERHSELIGNWSLSDIDGVAPDHSVFLEGTSKGLTVSGCGELHAVALRSSGLLPDDVREGTPCTDAVVRALQDLKPIFTSPTRTELSPERELVLVGRNGRRARFVPLMPLE